MSRPRKAKDTDELTCPCCGVDLKKHNHKFTCELYPDDIPPDSPSLDDLGIELGSYGD